MPGGWEDLQLLRAWRSQGTRHYRLWPEGAIAAQNRMRRPPLILRPSSGAHASTVHRPSAAESVEGSGSHRVCLTPVRFSPLTNSRTRPNCFSARRPKNHVRLADGLGTDSLQGSGGRCSTTRCQPGRRSLPPTCPTIPALWRGVEGNVLFNGVDGLAGPHVGVGRSDRKWLLAQRPQELETHVGCRVGQRAEHVRWRSLDVQRDR